MSKPKVIAFYLPQFHPTPENDEWWGKGFTEWTSVAKAVPLYRNHQQPKIPADLGFYDLRVPETRIAQAELAKEAGISAFCYWHYWFNGKQILNRPFEEVLKSKEPNFPFCLAWANHSWYNKEWSAGNSMIAPKSKILIEQTYGGIEDYTAHFYKLLPAFRDQRYFKIEGRNLFMVYNDLRFGDFERFAATWRALAKKENLPDFHFCTHICLNDEFDSIPDLLIKYDSVNLSLHRNPFESKRNNRPSLISRILHRIANKIKIKPEIISYKEALKLMDSEIFEESRIYPTIIPNWDHTPRSGRFGRVFQNCTPDLFQEHVKQIFKRLHAKKTEDQIVFLKSWNEWGEGNYMEPDLTFGKKYIYALRKCIEDYDN